ncbi:MAG: hypothetical protein K2Z81_18090 [Cyanobacteria bacterium]|nr:hypothetical protein [Cyanobacteriota bacterium]
MTKAVAPALRALLEEFIDYAGLFPPAGLSLDSALANFDSYRECDQSWMLRWFVISSSELGSVPESYNGLLSVLGSTDEPRAAVLETKAVVLADCPIYCEVSHDKLEQLDQIKQSSCFAKIRTGGLTPEAIPSPQVVAEFILACAERKLPFKATAGLHHPVRKEYALTYEKDAPRAIMHGFINVLLASAFAWNGKSDIEPILSEMDATAFSFDDRAHWRDLSLSADEIKRARQEFIHSVGSCSFEEPVNDLKALGLL